MKLTQVAVIALIAVAMVFIAGCTSTGIPFINHDGTYECSFGTGMFSVKLTSTISGANTMFENCVGGMCMRTPMIDNGNGTFTIGGGDSTMKLNLISFENGQMLMTGNSGQTMKFDKIK